MKDEVVDPDFLPFSEGELVEAEVLMGSTEAEARRRWQMVAKQLRATRERVRQGGARKGEARGYAQLGGPDVLLGLSLLSTELERRVRQHKFGRWEIMQDRLSPEQRDQLSGQRAEWEEEREQLRRRLLDEGKL